MWAASDRAFQKGLSQQAEPRAWLQTAYDRFCTRHSRLDTQPCLESTGAALEAAPERKCALLETCLAGELLYQGLCRHDAQCERTDLVLASGAWDFPALCTALEKAIRVAEFAKATEKLDRGRAEAEEETAQRLQELNELKELELEQKKQLEQELEQERARVAQLELKQKLQLESDLAHARAAKELEQGRTSWSSVLRPPSTWSTELRSTQLVPIQTACIDETMLMLEKALASFQLADEFVKAFPDGTAPVLWDAQAKRMDAAHLRGERDPLGRFEIVSIERVQNLTLWEQYAVKKASMIGRSAEERGNPLWSDGYLEVRHACTPDCPMCPATRPPNEPRPFNLPCRTSDCTRRATRSGGSSTVRSRARSQGLLHRGSIAAFVAGTRPGMARAPTSRATRPIRPTGNTPNRTSTGLAPCSSAESSVASIARARRI